MSPLLFVCPTRMGIVFQEKEGLKKAFLDSPNWKHLPPSRPLLLGRSEIISEEKCLMQEGMVNRQNGKYVGKSK